MDKKKFKLVLSNPIVVLLGTFAALIVAQVIAIITVNIFPIQTDLLIAGLVTGITLAVLLGISYSVLRIAKLGWGVLGIKRPSSGWLKRTVAYLFLYYLLSYSLQLLAALFIAQFDPTQAQNVGISSYSPLVFIQSFVVLVVLTPLLEEFLFRGMLFKGLRRRTGFLFAAGASSLLFAVAHGQWNVALDTFVLGLFLAKLVEETGSLVPAVALHSAKNLIALSLLFALQ